MMTHVEDDPASPAAAFAAAESNASKAFAEATAADGIKWEEGRLSEIVDQAEAALIRSDEKIFARGPMLVRVVRRKALSARNFKRDAGALGLVVVDVPYMVEALCRASNWTKFDRRTESLRYINAPDRVAITLLARVGKWKFPQLRAVTSTPTLRGDGSILQQPGYDAETGIYYEPGDVDFPRIEERPSEQTAKSALDRLVDCIKSFPFCEPVDLAVAVALMLTALIRRSLPSAPLGAITAPTMGSGKTLLADCIAILANGTSCPVMVLPASDEEAGKLVLSILVECEAVVLIDNIERPLSGDWLCVILTSEQFTQRLLGKNAMASVPTSTLVLATGNSLVLAGDTRTRAILCRIDPRMENPEEREFKGDLRETIAQARPALVADALTVMRWFVASGQRASDVVKPWGRFERWSDFVRAPLVRLGMEDPCLSLKFLERDDPNRARHLSLMLAWQAAFKSDSKLIREAIDLAIHSDVVLREGIEQVARDRSGQLDAMRLGKFMQRHAGRIVRGIEIERGDVVCGSATWRVIGRLTDVPS